MRNWFIFLSIVLLSCEETIRLDLKGFQSNVVIEAQVTNVVGKQFVKVSRTTDFYQTGKTPRITDATVTVSDDLGNVTTFVHNPGGSEDKEGYYYPEAPFTGEIGRTYTLEVIIDGTTYTATDELRPVITIDSLGVRVNQDEAEDPEVEGRIYELLMFAREPKETEDFYLFKFYRNNNLIYAGPTDIYFSDDAILGEEINGVATPVYYGLKDIGKIEVYSLTRSGYLFYNDLYNLLNNDGGMFSPPPVNCRTNLSNNALGFFQVSAVVSKEAEVEQLLLETGGW